MGSVYIELHPKKVVLYPPLNDILIIDEEFGSVLFGNECSESIQDDVLVVQREVLGIVKKYRTHASDESSRTDENNGHNLDLLCHGLIQVNVHAQSQQKEGKGCDQYGNPQ